MRITSVRDLTEGRRYRGDPNKVTVYKRGSLRDKDLRKLNFYVREGTNCRCEMLKAGKQFLLIMGHKEGKQMYMTFVHTWSKDRSFRSVIRNIQDGVGCPVQTTTIPPAAQMARNHGEEIPTEVLFPDSEHVSEEDPPSGPKSEKPRLTKEERRQMRREERRRLAEEAAAAAANGEDATAEDGQ